MYILAGSLSIYRESLILGGLGQRHFTKIQPITPIPHKQLTFDFVNPCPLTDDEIIVCPVGHQTKLEPNLTSHR